MKIIRIESSPKKSKRFRAILDDNSHIDFGLLGASTYIDEKDTKKRFNYWSRHYANKTERQLIDNMIISPSLLSAYLLWGPYTNLKNNITWLNKKLV